MSLGLGFGMGVTGRLNDLAAAVRSLFINNEQGAWYDPSDLSTLYQDAAGTTPVTAVEQTVGLMLDKRLGAVRGDNRLFTAPTIINAPWVDNGDGTYSIDGSQSVDTALHWGGRLTVGRFYEVQFEIISTGGGQAQAISNPNGVLVSGTGVKVSTLVAGSQNFNIMAKVGFSGTVRPMSVREILGNHASQATTTARPILRQDAGGRYYLSFDGVDDSLLYSPSSGAEALIVHGLSVTTPTINRFMFGGGDAAGGFSTIQSGATTYAAYAPAGVPNTAATTATPIVAGETVVMGGGYSGSRLSAFVGLAADTGTTTTIPAFPASVRLGASSAGGSHSAMRLYGHVDLRRIWTEAERVRVIRYLASKSGVTL